MSTDSWELSEELRQIQDTVSRFMAAEVKPVEDKLPHDAYELPTDVLERLQGKAREIGVWCVRSPEEYGGAGLNLLGQAVVAEEAAKCRMGAYVPACGGVGAPTPHPHRRGPPGPKQE
jgi:acyl-CoA dehydrogenase